LSEFLKHVKIEEV